ncbi:uncharacterized protein PgNI_02967 [Pyricularia grisea]|uniref:Uncharacterized protein n=1 Tax=Pyricularia grisea TaxID=148305 RepID=A0A6P8B9Q4_PYRGI|nr:uncharacterized protein PgNI_02967 [Pyricularia grisea]TLD12536.1 hypothetical protein PgNI_02967 [Pyricularia grisea]
MHCIKEETARHVSLASIRGVRVSTEKVAVAPVDGASEGPASPAAGQYSLAGITSESELGSYGIRFSSTIPSALPLPLSRGLEQQQPILVAVERM